MMTTARLRPQLTIRLNLRPVLFLQVRHWTRPSGSIVYHRTIILWNCWNSSASIYLFAIEWRTLITILLSSAWAKAKLLIIILFREKRLPLFSSFTAAMRSWRMMISFSLDCCRRFKEICHFLCQTYFLAYQIDQLTIPQRHNSERICLDIRGDLGNEMDLRHIISGRLWNVPGLSSAGGQHLVTRWIAPPQYAGDLIFPHWSRIAVLGNR